MNGKIYRLPKKVRQLFIDWYISRLDDNVRATVGEIRYNVTDVLILDKKAARLSQAGQANTK